MVIRLFLWAFSGNRVERVTTRESSTLILLKDLIRKLIKNWEKREMMPTTLINSDLSALLCVYYTILPL